MDYGVTQIPVRTFRFRQNGSHNGSVTTPSSDSVSLTRIAELAGVSIATVSRVVNNSRPVQPDVAAKVRKIMKDLRFSPVATRRGRPREDSRRPLNIAVVSLGMHYRLHFDQPVMSAVLGAILSAADDANMHTNMVEMMKPEELSPALLRTDIDGALVFAAGHLPPDAMDTLRNCCPVVRVMGGQLEPAEVDQVTADQTAVGFLASEYLVSLGCRKLAYANAHPNWDFGKLRSQGFISAAHTHGVEATAFLVTEDQSLQKIYGADSQLRPNLQELGRTIAEHRPDGIFVSRDAELSDLYRELAEHKIVPGRDVQIVSCDNESARLSMLHPRPASIDLGTSEIAYQAVQRMNWRVQNPEAKACKILVCPYIALQES